MTNETAPDRFWFLSERSNWSQGFWNSDPNAEIDPPEMANETDLIDLLNDFMGEYGDAPNECISHAVDALEAAQARIAELERVIKECRDGDENTFWEGKCPTCGQKCLQTALEGKG